MTENLTFGIWQCLLISCLAVIFHVWANNLRIEKGFRFSSCTSCLPSAKTVLKTNKMLFCEVFFHRRYVRFCNCLSCQMQEFIICFDMKFPDAWWSQLFFAFTETFVDKMASLNNSFACKSPYLAYIFVFIKMKWIEWLFQIFTPRIFF